MTRNNLEKYLQKLTQEQLIKIILETWDGFDDVLNKSYYKIETS